MISHCVWLYFTFPLSYQYANQIRRRYRKQYCYGKLGEECVLALTEQVSMECQKLRAKPNGYWCPAELQSGCFFLSLGNVWLLYDIATKTRFLDGSFFHGLFA